jgi:hypothetical protein
MDDLDVPSPVLPVPSTDTLTVSAKAPATQAQQIPRSPAGDPPHDLAFGLRAKSRTLFEKVTAFNLSRWSPVAARILRETWQNKMALLGAEFGRLRRKCPAWAPPLVIIKFSEFAADGF